MLVGPVVVDVPAPAVEVSGGWVAGAPPCGVNGSFVGKRLNVTSCAPSELGGTSVLASSPGAVVLVVVTATFGSAPPEVSGTVPVGVVEAAEAGGAAGF